MKVLQKKSLAFVLLLAMLFVCLFTGMGALTANADGTVFSYNFMTGRIKPGGVTDQDAIDAFETEGARLNAEIAAEGHGPFTVRAQPLGDGWPGNDSTHVAAQIQLGYDLGVNVWGMNDFGFVVFNPLMKQAFTVRGAAVVAYTNNTAGITHAGYPTGNQFEHEGTVYQNFALGYASGTAFHPGEKVSEEGVVSALTAEDIANGILLHVWDIDDGIHVAEIKAAYIAYYADKAINTNSFALTATSGWRQSDGNGGNVIYNVTRKAIYTVTSTFLNGFNTNTAKWGAPIGDETVIHEVTNQLFENGVAYVDEGEVKFAEASHVDEETGEIVPNFSAGSVGVVSAEATAHLPAGVTAAAVKTAVEAVYDSEMGIPDGEMEFFAYSTTRGFHYESEAILMQTFTGKDAQENATTTKIYLDVTAATLTAVVMDNDTYALYKIPTRFNEGNKAYEVTGEMVLGPAISGVITAGSTQYQNFLFGAINLTSTSAVTQVLPGVNYKADGTRTVLDLSDFITINEDTIHIPPSYGVTTDELLAKFKADYKAYIAQGIALGMPNQEGIGSWIPDVAAGGGYTADGEFQNGRGMIKLGLHMTDSDAICYYGVTAMLAYSRKDGKVYIMKDAVISNMATYYSVYGAPTSNLTETKLTTASGQEVTVWIQNFELGYLTVMGTSASMTADKNWDFNLRGPVNLDGSKIPGQTYPGETSGGDSGSTGGDTDNNGGNTATGGGKKKGCGSEISVAGGISAILLLVAAAAVVFAKRRKVTQ